MPSIFRRLFLMMYFFRGDVLFRLTGSMVEAEPRLFPLYLCPNVLFEQEVNVPTEATIIVIATSLIIVFILKRGFGPIWRRKSINYWLTTPGNEKIF